MAAEGRFPVMGHGTYVYTHSDGRSVNEETLREIYYIEMDVRKRLFTGEIDPTSRYDELVGRIHALESGDEIEIHFIPQTLYDLFYFEGMLEEELPSAEMGNHSFRREMPRHAKALLSFLPDYSMRGLFYALAFPFEEKGFFSATEPCFYHSREHIDNMIENYAIKLSEEDREQLNSYYDDEGSLCVEIDVVREFFTTREASILSQIREVENRPSYFLPCLRSDLGDSTDTFYGLPEEAERVGLFAYQAHQLASKKIVGAISEDGVVCLTAAKVERVARRLLDNCRKIADEAYTVASKSVLRRDTEGMALSGWALIQRDGLAERITELALAALRTEIAPLAVTHALLYRGGSLTEDSVVQKGNSHLLSFGTSLFAGDLYDASSNWTSSAEAILHMISRKRDAYILPVPYEELSSHFYYPLIPINTGYFAKGELWHPRTRLASDSDRYSGIQQALYAFTGDLRALIGTEKTMEAMDADHRRMMEGVVVLAAYAETKDSEEKTLAV